ncbi:MAG: sensor histidine kinase [Halioglobus sp.]|nr:sensor histidine kinase [Halioglobus sp.]
MAFGKFAKYSPDEISFNPRQFDLVKEIDTLVDYVRREDAARHSLSFRSTATALSAHTDPVHLKYILVNLLQNAVKYSAPGTAIEVALHEQDNTALLVVTDQGIGIPGDALDELFSPFYRANNVDGRPGTGLGLAIVKRAARIIGARLEVDSKLDSGTRFTVHIPLRGGFN